MVNLIRIDDASDPRVADYVSVRERDLTGRDGKFIVEGRVTLDVLLRRSRFEVASVFIGESRVEPLAETLALVPDDVPIYAAPQSVMDDVVGFAIHRGILACGLKGEGLGLESVFNTATPSERFAPTSPAGGGGRSRQSRTVLVLNGLSNHDNVGAAFRNAAAFGADGVLLDERSCDPLYRKAIRVSAGASLWLPFYHGGTGAEHIEALKAVEFEIWAMTPRLEAGLVHERPVPDKLAIVLGAEGPGLPDQLIEAGTAIRLPMQQGFDSINVATAGAIALAHVFSARNIG